VISERDQICSSPAQLTDEEVTPVRPDPISAGAVVVIPRPSTAGRRSLSGTLFGSDDKDHVVAVELNGSALAALHLQQ
jgi:hypothetical protein